MSYTSILNMIGTYLICVATSDRRNVIEGYFFDNYHSRRRSLSNNTPQYWLSRGKLGTCNHFQRSILLTCIDINYIHHKGWAEINYPFPNFYLFLYCVSWQRCHAFGVVLMICNFLSKQQEQAFVTRAIVCAWKCECFLLVTAKQILLWCRGGNLYKVLLGITIIFALTLVVFNHAGLAMAAVYGLRHSMVKI